MAALFQVAAGMSGLALIVLLAGGLVLGEFHDASSAIEWLTSMPSW